MAKAQRARAPKAGTKKHGGPSPGARWRVRNDVLEKLCNRCGKYFPADEEHFRPLASGYLQSMDRDCEREWDAERWREKRAGKQKAA